MSHDTPTEPGALPIRSAGENPAPAGDHQQLLRPGAPPLDRRERLASLFHEARECTLCPQLVATRTQVVFGSGNADAELMFVGEAPGAREDEQGVPFVGASGKLLDELLGSIGLDRADVFIANVLKCRPPGNRDPAPVEITRCRPYLHEQIALIEPRVVCTLGNFATKLLRDDKTGIKAIHGQPQLIQLGRRVVYLLPLYHPAAALYTRSLLDTLRADIAKLPELMARPAPAQPDPEEQEQAAADVAPGAGAATTRAADAAPEITESPSSEMPRKRKASADEPETDEPQLGLF